MGISKRHKNNLANYNKYTLYDIKEAIALVKSFSKVKFDESFDMAINLGVDPRHADQLVRGTITLPHGSGKQSRVVVVTKDENVKTALDAGADYAGAADILEKIKGLQSFLQLKKMWLPS